MRLCFWEVLKDGKGAEPLGGGPVASRRGRPLLGAASAPRIQQPLRLEGQAGAAQVPAALGTVRGPVEAQVGAGDSPAGGLFATCLCVAW